MCWPTERATQTSEGNLEAEQYSVSERVQTYLMMTHVSFVFQEFEASFQKDLEDVNHLKDNIPAHMAKKKGPAK